MDPSERVIPSVSANYLYQEALARYLFASKLIRKNSLVLDLGCGTGYGTNFLSRKAAVIGVDNSRQAVAYARKHFSGVEFKVSRAQKLNFNRGTFDAVISFEVIEHLRQSTPYLKEIKRVLKNGGLFVLSTPNKNFPQVTRSPYHFKEYDQQEILKLLKKYFEKVELFGQSKNKKARRAFQEYLKSQEARQTLVDTDSMGLRKLIPRSIKEFLWRYLGNLFGRKAQNQLTIKDFPITKKPDKDTEYFVVVCQSHLHPIT